MNTDNTTIEVIRLSIDSSKPALTIESNWYLMGVVFLLFLILLFVWRKYLSQKFNIYDMEVEISGSPKASFKVQRNDENLFIANRIYIELTTRKAAIPIDEENDVIEEVYNSWYKLFGIIRDEIKTVPGRYLKSHDPTIALIGLTTKILNEGLRPHLTEHQAKFRRWYEQEKAKNENISPQELQRRYPDYVNLIASMKQVNQTLLQYSNELNKLLRG
ncbi:hypothetical protein METP2_01195 [Methanosarcinales archaeon]|nr:hypothetical protein METP2_01195 [Methanosarcinales archaeon]